jgi:hypothetical protein
VVALLDDDAAILQPTEDAADDVTSMAEALEQLILAKLLSRPDSAKDDVVL